MSSLKVDVNANSKNDCFTDPHFLEEVDVKKLYALTQSKGILQEDSSWWEDINIDWSSLHNGNIPNEKNFIENMLHKVTKIGDKYFLKVRYFSRRDFGRVYPVKSQSLGIMRRPIRHFLCDGLYYDVDMVAAHQSILKDICDGYGIECPELNNYLENRDELFKKYSGIDKSLTRDVVKCIYIRIMYGSSLKKIFRDYDIPMVAEKKIFKKSKKEGKKLIQKTKKINLVAEFAAFETEIKHINMALYKIVGQEFYDKLTKHKSRNKDGTFLSLYLQMWELEILDCCVEVAKNKGLITKNNCEIILAHDGFMIKQDLFNAEYDINNLIDDINFEIEEELGMSVKVKVKEFDEKDEVYEALRKQNISYTDDYVDAFEKKYGCMRDDLKFMKNDDERISELFYCNQKDKYAYCDKIFYGLVNNGLYKQIKDKTFRNTFSNYMKDFIEELDRQELDHEEHSKDVLIEKINEISALVEEHKLDVKKGLLNDKFYQEMFDNAEKLSAGAKNKIRDKILNESKKSYLINRLYQKFSNDRFEEILDTNPNLLGFENGVWDCRTNEFRDAREGEYVSMSVGYDWNNEWCNNETAPEWLKERASVLLIKLREMFKEEDDLNYILKAAARCLEGDSNREEVAHFMKGVGANGKSLFITLMRLVMGDYYYNMPYTYFSNPSKDNRDPTLFGAAKKRFIEVNEPNEKFVWNADVFKRTTGNDIIGARNNYQTKDIHFKMGHIWCAANHFIRFNSDTGGNSMKRRIRGAEFPFVFKPVEAHEEWKKNHDKKHHWKLKAGDDDFKTHIESGYFNEALMFILMGAFKMYKEEGITLTKNFKEDTIRYFDELSEDKAWFVDNIRKRNAEDKKVNINVKDLRIRHNEDQNVNWSGKWFLKKIREFYPDAEIKNTNGFDIWGNKSKGKMLCGYVFIGDVTDDLDCDSDDGL